MGNTSARRTGSRDRMRRARHAEKPDPIGRKHAAGCNALGGTRHPNSKGSDPNWSERYQNEHGRELRGGRHKNGSQQTSAMSRSETEESFASDIALSSFIACAWSDLQPYPSHLHAARLLEAAADPALSARQKQSYALYRSIGRSPQPNRWIAPADNDTRYTSISRGFRTR